MTKIQEFIMFVGSLTLSVIAVTAVAYIIYYSFYYADHLSRYMKSKDKGIKRRLKKRRRMLWDINIGLRGRRDEDLAWLIDRAYECDYLIYAYLYDKDAFFKLYLEEERKRDLLRIKDGD